MSITQKVLDHVIAVRRFGYAVDSWMYPHDKGEPEGLQQRISSPDACFKMCALSLLKEVSSHFLFGERSHGPVVFFIHISVHNSL